MTLYRNRKNGKKYEGELVKLFRQAGLFARLGRSNEEGDIILPDHNIIIEAKSTNGDRYLMSKNPDQYHRLCKLEQEIWYAVRYKGRGRGWRFYKLPPSIQVLHEEQSLTFKEFIMDSSVHPRESLDTSRDNSLPEIRNASNDRFRVVK
jgi:Holliday junction resolvase